MPIGKEKRRALWDNKMNWCLKEVLVLSDTNIESTDIITERFSQQGIARRNMLRMPSIWTT